MDKVMDGRKILYELAVSGVDETVAHREDTPMTYRVVECEKKWHTSGVIVYGEYSGGRWIANPNCRHLIAHLLRVMK